MESVYFYKNATEASVKEVLKSDEFMRISFTTRTAAYEEQNGYYLYITATEEELSSLDIKLEELSAKKLKTFERDIVISQFKQDEENAASGVGLLFG